MMNSFFRELAPCMYNTYTLTIPVRGCDPNFTYLNVKTRNRALRKTSLYNGGGLQCIQAIKAGPQHLQVPHTV